MGIFVSENIEVTNCNPNVLKKIKEESNTIETGAGLILEGLELFIKESMSHYHNESEIPYEKMFKALKDIISSSLDNRKIMESVMTGVVNIKKNFMVETPVVNKAKPRGKGFTGNKDELIEFSKTHTSLEIFNQYSEHFASLEACRVYLTRHKIEYIKEVAHRKGYKFNEKELVEFSRGLSNGQFINITNISRQTVRRYKQKYNLPLVDGRRGE